MLIYVITDRTRRPDLTPETIIDAVADSGADMIQIREKDLGGLALLRLTRRAVASAHPGVFVNGRADVAMAASAAGVHLPSRGCPASDIRRAWPGRLRIGVSTHSLEEATGAERDGADFITFGPVFDTPSKRAFGAPVGIAALERVARSVRLPVLAIGGVDATRVRDLRSAGAAGAAVISAVITAPDMRRAVERLRDAALA